MLAFDEKDGTICDAAVLINFAWNFIYRIWNSVSDTTDIYKICKCLCFINCYFKMSNVEIHIVLYHGFAIICKCVGLLLHVM